MFVDFKNNVFENLFFFFQETCFSLDKLIFIFIYLFIYFFALNYVCQVKKQRFFIFYFFLTKNTVSGR